MPLLTLSKCHALTLSKLTLTFIGLAYVTLHLSLQSLHILNELFVEIFVLD